ncbi:squalene--hopene cyclase [Azospirillum brasilense]|uniref:Squalene--hopene cyclase n=1 Tax=Azospirillum brasilense TaxID=192 RepID=A0A6L3AUP6_AZOBR|nr:squalene--hopene cyclase [Azospirillum brasilense]KAA0680797.1 squalene--hopene cyclase [Azospirillum brasilense]
MAAAILTGMALEARLARRSGLPVACATGGAAAAVAAHRLLESGACGVVSFGIAGGLAPDLRPGSLVLATAVVDEDGAVFEVCQSWWDRLHGALPQARSALVAGARMPAATVGDKARLRALTGAAAVDLESLAVARACQAWGRPFAVLRAVADPAWRALPAAALAGLDGSGRIAPGAVLARLIADPRDVVALGRLAWDLGRALASLRGATQAIPANSLGGGPFGLDPAERVRDVA